MYRRILLAYDGSESGQQHAESSGGGGDRARLRHPTILTDIADCNLAL